MLDAAEEENGKGKAVFPLDCDHNESQAAFVSETATLVQWHRKRDCHSRKVQ